MSDEVAIKAVEDLRKHVIDDALELIESLGIVTPLVTHNISVPTQRFFRRLLTRNVILVLTRLHARSGKGPTGVTASIDAVLEAATKSAQMRAAEVDGFRTRREALLKDMELEGVGFWDLQLFRHSELAHSLHAPSANRTGLSWYVIVSFAHGTYKLVRDIEGALIKGGAVQIHALPAEKYEEWMAHGRAQWPVP